MKRGEIWTAATGAGLGSKPRPVVILQSSHYLHFSTVIVALLTSKLEERLHLRPVVAPDDVNGLDKISAVMVDVLVTAESADFGKRVGRLSAADMVQVESALLIVLGFAA